MKENLNRGHEIKHGCDYNSDEELRCQDGINFANEGPPQLRVFHHVRVQPAARVGRA